MDELLLVTVFATGGLVGYALRSWIAARETTRIRERDTLRHDLMEQRFLLLEFLEDEKSDFEWLQTVSAERLEATEPEGHEKVQKIAAWIAEYGPRFPDDVREHLRTIEDAAPKLLDPGTEPYRWVRLGEGNTAVEEAWGALRAYEIDLRRRFMRDELSG